MSTDAIFGRDWHLFGPGPKHILALSGGGVRGALTVAFLERIEQLLDEKYGTKVRLGDHFDLIGGTSTGALIAGALAMGYRTAQIKEFYVEHARSVFRPRAWTVPVLQSRSRLAGGGTRADAGAGGTARPAPDRRSGLGERAVRDGRRGGAKSRSGRRTGFGARSRSRSCNANV